MGAQPLEVALATYSLPTLITVGSGKAPEITGFALEAESVAPRATPEVGSKAAMRTSEKSTAATPGVPWTPREPTARL